MIGLAVLFVAGLSVAQAQLFTAGLGLPGRCLLNCPPGFRCQLVRPCPFCPTRPQCVSALSTCPYNPTGPCRFPTNRCSSNVNCGLLGYCCRTTNNCGNVCLPVTRPWNSPPALPPVFNPPSVFPRSYGDS